MRLDMVDGQGLEPRMPEAPDLQSGAVTCSARHPLERVKRIELLSSAWKAEVMAIIRHPHGTSSNCKRANKKPWVFSPGSR